MHVSLVVFFIQVHIHTLTHTQNTINTLSVCFGTRLVVSPLSLFLSNQDNLETVGKSKCLVLSLSMTYPKKRVAD